MKSTPTYTFCSTHRVKGLVCALERHISYGQHSSPTAVHACHNSLLWFIERVELLTPDPIRTQQYFFLHLELAFKMPAQRPNFRLEQKYLTAVWKGKGEGNYRGSWWTAVQLLMTVGRKCWRSCSFWFQGEGNIKERNTLPKGNEDIKRQRKNKTCVICGFLSLSFSFSTFSPFSLSFFHHVEKLNTLCLTSF